MVVFQNLSPCCRVLMALQIRKGVEALINLVEDRRGTPYLVFRRSRLVFLSKPGVAYCNGITISPPFLVRRSRVGNFNAAIDFAEYLSSSLLCARRLGVLLTGL